MADETELIPDLLLVGFPGDEEGQGVAARGLDLGARPAINGLLGFQGWLGILPSMHTLKVVYNEASEGESVKEVVAKDFEVFPLIFGLHVSGDTFKQVPERKK